MTVIPEEGKRRRSPARFTSEQKAVLFREWWVEGKRLVDLAEQYDLSVPTIHRLINEYEATLPLESRITKDEMRARRARMDKARRMAAVRRASG